MTARKPLYLMAALAAAPFLSGLAVAQMGQMGGMHEQGGGPTTRPMNAQQMQQRREQMRQRMQKMQQETKQMDQRLADKVAAMNKAQGQEKIDAMAAVIDELVQQRQTMDAQRTDMMDRMLEHMQARDQMMDGGPRRGMMRDGKDKGAGGDDD